MLILLAACSSEEPAPHDGGEERSTGCNGSDALCDRAVNEVLWAQTHNSHASEERGYELAAMNHYNAIPSQLADGIRALNVDIYEEEGNVIACHGFCVLGNQDLQELLAEVTDFLDANEREVVLMALQDEAPADTIRDEFEQAGLDSLAWTQEPGTPWPTLQEMIDADQRFVLFSKNNDGQPGWYHRTGDFWWGTHWHFRDPDELGCDVGAPIEHGLLEIVHTITDPIASPEAADEINHNPFLVDRLRRCADEIGVEPNVVSVDYYSLGDVLEAVDILNAEVR